VAHGGIVDWRVEEMVADEFMLERREGVSGISPIPAMKAIPIDEVRTASLKQ
jgi:hypothetical protein